MWKGNQKKKTEKNSQRQLRNRINQLSRNSVSILSSQSFQARKRPRKQHKSSQIDPIKERRQQVVRRRNVIHREKHVDILCVRLLMTRCRPWLLEGEAESLELVAAVVVASWGGGGAKGGQR